MRTHRIALSGCKASSTAVQSVQEYFGIAAMRPGRHQLSLFVHMKERRSTAFQISAAQLGFDPAQ
jgi:hypothetical protein